MFNGLALPSSYAKASMFSGLSIGELRFLFSGLVNVTFWFAVVTTGMNNNYNHGSHFKKVHHKEETQVQENTFSTVQDK